MSITTHYLGGNEPYELVAERYGVCKATAYDTVLRVSQGSVDNYVDRFIKWPTGQAALSVIEKFEELQGFPGVIGAIDGSHIPITPPEASSQDYQNRKKFIAFNCKLYVMQI